jgi:hypothetical protein
MRRPDLKVLFITAYDLLEEQAIGRVLRKPISPEELVSQVQNALESKKGQG